MMFVTLSKHSIGETSLSFPAKCGVDPQPEFGLL